MMEIGLVGKPNVGKSTFFEASTLAGAEIANYPFTTIKANMGMAAIRGKCPCIELNVTCSPKNSTCRDGTRIIPIELLDVAGLVPDAHSGKGLGNQFLDDLRQANALIHVVDISGSTDEEGNPVDRGSHDPMTDMEFLDREIDFWFDNIISRDWTKLSRTTESMHGKIEVGLSEKVSGLGINVHQIFDSIIELGLDRAKPTKWSEEELFSLASTLRKRAKPMIIAANKADRLDENDVKRLPDRVNNISIIPTFAEAELALKRAEHAGMIDYLPGEGEFKIKDPSSLSQAQTKGLDRIREILDTYGSTNVQKVLESATYDLLDLIVVYPVEDEHRYTDHDGRILPDAHLVPQGSSAKDLAYKVHTDLGDHFIKAIDCRTDMTIGHDHQLKNGDVIKIHANR